MGLSHIYRAIKTAHPQINFAEAHTMAQKVAGSWWMKELSRTPTAREWLVVPFATGPSAMTFDIEAYGGWDKSAWPIDDDAPNRQLQAYHSRFGVLGRAQAERRTIDPDKDRRHRLWQEQNGLTPSERERFETLLTSMTTGEALDVMAEQKRRDISPSTASPVVVNTGIAWDTRRAHALATGADCPEDCACCICVGQLSYCKVCKGGESSLPSECPGVEMTDEQQRYVTYGALDFKNGEWFKPRKPAQ